MRSMSRWPAGSDRQTGTTMTWRHTSGNGLAHTATRNPDTTSRAGDDSRPAGAVARDFRPGPARRRMAGDAGHARSVPLLLPAARGRRQARGGYRRAVLPNSPEVFVVGQPLEVHPGKYRHQHRARGRLAPARCRHGAQRKSVSEFRIMTPRSSAGADLARVVPRREGRPIASSLAAAGSEFEMVASACCPCVPTQDGMLAEPGARPVARSAT